MFHYCYISGNSSLDKEFQRASTAEKSSIRLHDAHVENQSGAKSKQTKQKHENNQHQLPIPTNDVRNCPRKVEVELSSSVRSLSIDQHQPPKSSDRSSSGNFYTISKIWHNI